MNLNRLTTGERLVGAGAVVLVLASFLHWLGGRVSTINLAGRSIPVAHYSFDRSAWGYAVTGFGVAIAVGVLVYLAVILAVSDDMLRRWPRSAASILVAFCTLAFALVALKVLIGADVTLSSFGLPSTSGVAVRVSFEKTRQIGAYIGVAASGTMFVGAWVNARHAPT